VAGNPFAFVIADKERPTPEAVIAYCKRRLPPQLVPRFVIFMEDFPRTFIGKVLRRELAKRYEKRLRECFLSQFVANLSIRRMLAM
jgi:acyl-CoA synthetase (AMP-forming)/AMP-acid ligase II